MTAISFRDVSYAYDEEGFRIEHLNTEIEEGEFLAVLGHNGSGKSSQVKSSCPTCCVLVESCP